MKLVECVPNFSEGRDQDKIRAITREIEAVAGVKLLDVDPGASTNRTVVTFIGGAGGGRTRPLSGPSPRPPRSSTCAAHKGAHSRIGRDRRLPLRPRLRRDHGGLRPRWPPSLGRRVADELGIPVYLYEAAARKPERRNLATVRAGEYEGLPEKLKDPRWAPDFGKPVFNPKSGATVVGAREFLIAYNVNLNTRDRKLAHEIALSLRESGRAKRDKDGNVVKDAARQHGQGAGQVQGGQVRRLVRRGLRHGPDLGQLHQLQGHAHPRRLRRSRPPGREARPAGDGQRAGRPHPQGGPAHGRPPLSCEAGQEPGRARRRSSSGSAVRSLGPRRRRAVRSGEEDHRIPVPRAGPAAGRR
ncbi:MAG: hypothetical protein MZV70_66775 [Desulfobacterales bacterium]|nr:hypothetical protein [Desulfobacterales bacterium]